ncbi:MAG: hypothetical protein ACOH2M_31805 [Cypionkella sp.]
MAKIAAIHGGGDWADASAEYLILPDGMSISVEQRKRNKWYQDEYCPALGRGEKPQFFTLHQWCLARGAREPTESELEIFQEW